VQQTIAFIPHNYQSISYSVQKIAIIESCLSKTPQAQRITALAPNPPYIAQGWRRYPKCARMARFFGYPKTGFYFAAINKFHDIVQK